MSRVSCGPFYDGKPKIRRVGFIGAEQKWTLAGKRALSEYVSPLPHSLLPVLAIENRIKFYVQLTAPGQIQLLQYYHKFTGDPEPYCPPRHTKRAHGGGNETSSSLQ